MANRSGVFRWACLFKKFTKTSFTISCLDLSFSIFTNIGLKSFPENFIYTFDL